MRIHISGDPVGYTQTVEYDKYDEFVNKYSPLVTANICKLNGVNEKDDVAKAMLAYILCNSDELEFYYYNSGRFHLKIHKKIADKFSDIVCPINEVELKGHTRFYEGNKYVTDEVMSAIVEASMLRELHQYD